MNELLRGYRDAPQGGDPAAVERLVAATGFFNDAETRIARELVEDRLRHGEVSGYSFVFEDGAPGELLGYACYGPIDGTAGSFDLYWIAIAPHDQGRGRGRRLLTDVERRIRQRGGQRVWVETSSREQYEPTRAFYERCGYRRAAMLPDYYASGDGKIVYVKAL
jgi:D-alanine-D-alanine ligase